MRPTLPKSLLRNKMVEARFSPIELEMLRHRARDAGISMAEFVRRSCLLRPLPKRVSKVTLNTYVELGRIGNNINQLTKAVNTALKLGMQPPAALGELLSLSALLHECRRSIAAATNSDETDDETDNFSDEEDFSGDDDWEAD